MGLLDSLANTLLDVYVRQPALMKEQQALQDRQLQEQLLSQAVMQGRMPQNVNISNFDPNTLSTLSTISNTIAQRRQQMANQIDQMVQSKVMPPEMGAILKFGLNSNHPELFASAFNSYMGYKGRTESANTMAGAQVKSAAIGAQGRVEAAEKTREGRVEAAGVMAKSQEDVANTKAATQRYIANLNATVNMRKALQDASKFFSGNFANIVKFQQQNANSDNLSALTEDHNQAVSKAAVRLEGGIGFALEHSIYNIPNVGHLSFGLKSAVRDAIARNLGGSRIPPKLRKAYAAAMAELDRNPGPAIDQLHKSGLLDDESFQAFLDQLKRNMEYFQDAQTAQ
jgi:hypothetical protein